MKDSLIINQLTLCHLADQSSIYFGEQGFTLKALKESVQPLRQRRDLHRAEPLTSGAASHQHWSSTLFKRASSLVGWGNWRWPSQLAAWSLTASPSQKYYPTVSSGGGHLPSTQDSGAVNAYTVGHFQGLLQLVDLWMRKWSQQQYPQPINIPHYSTGEAAVRAGEFLDDFYQAVQSSALACGIKPTLVAQPLDSINLSSG